MKYGVVRGGFQLGEKEQKGTARSRLSAMAEPAPQPGSATTPPALLRAERPSPKRGGDKPAAGFSSSANWGAADQHWYFLRTKLKIPIFPPPFLRFLYFFSIFKTFFFFPPGGKNLSLLPETTMPLALSLRRSLIPSTPRQDLAPRRLRVPGIIF